MPPLLVARHRAAVIARSLLAAAGVVFATGCDQPAPAATTPPPPPAVGITTVALKQVHPSDELTGRVEAIHDVAVRARVAGYVTSVNYREGSEVAKNAVLFTIDARPYQAALARANAELARAKAGAVLAAAELARTEKLVASNAIPKNELETRTAAAAQATAEVHAAEAAVQIAALDVEFTQVRASMAGRTGQANVSVGDYVSTGPAPTVLTTLVSVDPIYVYFTGDEQTFLNYASHSQDSPVAIGLENESGYPHAGKIDFVDNRLDAATGTIRLRAVVPNTDKRLTPGLYARVRLDAGNELQAVLIDDKAILTDQDRKYVYVLGAGDTVERRDVQLGRIVDGARLISKGLAPGDRVITNGTQKVYPGSKATVAAAEPPKPTQPSAGATP